MQTKDIMTTNVVTVMPETGVRDIARLLLTHHISAVPVLAADGQFVGIVRDGDLIHRVETGTERHRSWWLTLLADPERLAHDYVKAHGMRAGDVMARDIESVRPETPLDEVADRLEKRHVRSLPVLQEGKVVGMVSRADLLRALAARPARAKAPGSVDDETIRKRLWQALRSADWLNAAYARLRQGRGGGALGDGGLGRTETGPGHRRQQHSGGSRRGGSSGPDPSGGMGRAKREGRRTGASRPVGCQGAGEGPAGPRRQIPARRVAFQSNEQADVNFSREERHGDENH